MAALRQIDRQYTLLLARGNRGLRTGRYVEAVTDFRAARFLRATPEASRGLALAHLGLRDFSQAVAWHTRALARNGVNASCEK